MEAILYVYGKMGGQYKVIGGKLLNSPKKGSRLPCSKSLGQNILDFPQICSTPFLAACLTIPGVSQVEETIFENRFKVVCQLQKMGGKIWCDKSKGGCLGRCTA